MAKEWWKLANGEKKYFFSREKAEKKIANRKAEDKFHVIEEDGKYVIEPKDAG